MNTAKFLAEQRQYFEKSYEEFRFFGGPSVYFHEQCLRAASDAFLSVRHVEMLYATLAAWGMHRMGDPDATKTKLTDWDEFHDSANICANLPHRFLRVISWPSSSLPR